MINDRSVKYVNFVISRASDENDTGFAAKLKRAESESTEYQCWEILSQWTNLENQTERKAFGLIGASIAHQLPEADGEISIGKALRRTDSESNSESITKSSAAARLRRLISCSSSAELIQVLRPTLNLIASKNIVPCYARLLDEILKFDFDNSRTPICARWAQDFFARSEEGN